MTFDRSTFFPGTPVPLPIKLTPRYNWNSVESGVKHYNPNLARFIVCKLLSVMNIQQYNISCNTAVNQTRHLNSFSHYLIHVSIIQCYKDYFISTKTASSASFLDIYLELDTKDNLSIRFYDKGEETTSILPLQSSHNLIVIYIPLQRMEFIFHHSHVTPVLAVLIYIICTIKT